MRSKQWKCLSGMAGKITVTMLLYVTYELGIRNIIPYRKQQTKRI